MSTQDIRTVYQCNVWAKELKDQGIECHIVNDESAECCANGPFVVVPQVKIWLGKMNERAPEVFVVSDDCVERIADLWLKYNEKINE